MLPLSQPHLLPLKNFSKKVFQYFFILFYFIFTIPTFLPTYLLPSTTIPTLTLIFLSQNWTSGYKKMMRRIKVDFDLMLFNWIGHSCLGRTNCTLHIALLHNSNFSCPSSQGMLLALLIAPGVSQIEYIPSCFMLCFALLYFLTGCLIIGRKSLGLSYLLKQSPSKVKLNYYHERKNHKFYY